MQKWLVTYFGFSRRELNGIWVLALALLFLWGISHILSFGKGEAGVDLAVQIAEIDGFLATLDKQSATVNNSGSRTNVDQHVDASGVTYFTFDPNGLPVSDWKRLGLSERQIQMIKNYETKGGRFRKKADLAKIYAISDADYARLEPYIRIASVGASRPVTLPSPRATGPDGTGNRRAQVNLHTVSPKPTPLHLDLNDADSVELQYLPGIGPIFASRIVRFRELLGGFHHVSQLMDVYGFDSVRFSELKSQVYVNTAKVEKISINTADYARFRSHPFINHKLANAIVQYRKQHGPYRTISDLLGIAIMDEQIFRKIAPYLTLGNE